MPPRKTSPSLLEARALAGAAGAVAPGKGGRAKKSIADRLATLEADKVLDVSDFTAEGTARKIKSPTAGLTRVNSKGHDVIVHRTKFGNDKIISNNAASYAAAMYSAFGGSYAQYEREWNDVYRAYMAARERSMAASEQRKAERPRTTRPSTGRPVGRPKGSKNKPKMPMMAAAVAIEQQAVADVERDIATRLSASAAQHSAAARSASAARLSASPRLSAARLSASPKVMSPRMSPGRMMSAAGIPR